MRRRAALALLLAGLVVGTAWSQESTGVQKRLDRLDEDELRRELRDTPQVHVDAVPGTSIGLLRASSILQAQGKLHGGPALLTRERRDLAGIPMRMGNDCLIGKDAAEELTALSRKLRVCLEKATPSSTLDPRLDLDKFRAALASESDEWLRPEAVPALLQLLQAEGKSARLVLVEYLDKIPGRRATAALAVRAMVDLSPEVRDAAVAALKRRPAEEYRGLLLAGLRYPWHRVIEHAAEAVVELHATDVIPELTAMVDEPDPCFPVRPQGSDKLVVRELVAINHLGNCLLCHAPSFNRTDLVRGAVPSPGLPLPGPATTPAYYERGGTSFVRADVTYLRQDFSVMQAVPSPGVWPGHQRFDYMVRLRTLNPRELRLIREGQVKPSTRPRDAVLFALRELTGQDLGMTSAEWRRVTPMTHKLRTIEELTRAAAVDDWRQFLPPGDKLHAIDVDSASVAPSVGVAAPAAQDEDPAGLGRALLRATGDQLDNLIVRLRDGKGVAYTDALAGALTKLSGSGLAKARQALVDRLTRMSAATLRNKFQSDDAEIRRAAALAAAAREDRAMVPDLIDLLLDDDVSVIAGAHDALTRLTGKDFGPEPGADRDTRIKAAVAWERWLKGK